MSCFNVEDWFQILWEGGVEFQPGNVGCEGKKNYYFQLYRALIIKLLYMFVHLIN